jgi:3-deoxy-D-manno-octulosonic-acid transferase
MTGTLLFYFRIDRILNRLLWPILLPGAGFIWLFFPRTRPFFRERLGFGVSKATGQPSGSQKTSGAVLFHVASLGEAVAATPLIRALSERHSLVLTATTLTGREALTKAFPDHSVSLVPFDLPDLWIPFLKSREIRKILLFETEIWPSMLLSAFHLGVKVGIVNGRLSTRGFRRMSRFRPLFVPLFQLLDPVVVQSALDQDRFRKMGTLSRNIHLGGNLKWDVFDPRESVQDPEELRFWVQRVEEDCLEKGKKPFRLLLSSVHPEETKQILRTLEKGLSFPRPLHILIAPRHLNRLETFRSFLPKETWVQDRRERFCPEEGGSKSLPMIFSLLDTYGELRTLTRFCDLVVVGGTFDPVGGHSPIDAAAAGIPLIVGPHTDHIREIVCDLKEGGGMLELHRPDLLSEILCELMMDPEKMAKMGEDNRNVFSVRRGALMRTMSFLRPFLEGESVKRAETDL